MNIFKKFYCRTYQFLFRIALPILPYRQPKILENNNEIIDILKSKNINKLLLVTDKTIRNLGLINNLQKELKNNNFDTIIFDEIFPNPTITQVENGLKIYLENNCKCIIAIGGGSVIDCAKVIGARVVKPNKSVKKMKGLLKICKKLPTFIAIPTTAGTGSETTLTAVITDDQNHHKYTINDFSLIPHYALLDYNLTLGLNKKITSTTGMDALTHAIEAYIGQSTTPQTRNASIEAIRLINENLKEAYDNPSNAVARQNMLKASYLAGVAFTKSYVGYVHAIAHTLGGKYNTPHGLANAIILPIMLKVYGNSVTKKLAKLAKLTHIANNEDDNKVASDKFILWIENLNSYFDIPKHVDHLDLKDIDELSTLADKEANPLYPVPKLLDKKALSQVYKKLIKN